MVLLGPNGRPLSAAVTTTSRRPKPLFGYVHGDWAGRDPRSRILPPSMASVQFDLSRLTLSDYRAMRDHYQVNSSLSVLAFMQHQSDWHLEGGKAKVRDLVERNLRGVWTQLNRALSVANWAGFAPCVVEWENDTAGGEVVLSKIRDLVPEECSVNWKDVDGWAPPGEPKPKFKVYDGIRQYGARWPIPVESSLWFPMLMEEGDYSGRKLLKAAFQPWFFSLLLHMYSNRYYERHGEPTPVGRAPVDAEYAAPDGTTVPAMEYMADVISQLRSRSAVVLPSDRDPETRSFDYEVAFMETQQRGADFEKYLQRLDEEITLALFTPLLMMRTADVGSYNLGVGHMQTFNWEMNALNDDRAQFLKVLVRRIVDFNFGTAEEAPEFVFRKLGTASAELLRDIVTQMIGAKAARVDVGELGRMIGMTLKEVEDTVAPATVPAPADPNADPNVDPNADPNVDPGAPPPGTGKWDKNGNAPDRNTDRSNPDKAAPSKALAGAITSRLAAQVRNQAAHGGIRPGSLSPGHRRQLDQLLVDAGHADPAPRRDRTYAALDGLLCSIGAVTADPGRYVELLAPAVESLIANSAGM